MIHFYFKTTLINFPEVGGIREDRTAFCEPNTPLRDFSY